MLGNEIFSYALYFLLYAIVSFLGTILTQAIVNRQSLRAWPIEFLQTIFLVYVLEKVVKDSSDWAIFMVAAGGATGTVVAIEWRKWMEKKQRKGRDNGS